MDFTTLPFEYEGRYASEYRDLGFSIEQGAWLEQRDRDLEDHLAGLPSGGSGKPYATLVVAASNSQAPGAAGADYVCSGTSDEVTIQEAIDALGEQGGRVLLLDGTYDIRTSVDLMTNGSIYNTSIHLEGMGNSSILSTANWTGGATYAIECAPDSPRQEAFAAVRHLRIVAPRGTVAGGVRVTGTAHLYVERLLVDAITGTGTRPHGLSLSGGLSVIQSCVVRGADVGFTFDSTDASTVSGLLALDCLTGFSIQYTADAAFCDLHAYGSSTVGFELIENYKSAFADLVISGSGGPALTSSYETGCVVSASAVNPAGDGFVFDLDAPYRSRWSLFVEGESTSAAGGLRVSGGEENDITGSFHGLGHGSPAADEVLLLTGNTAGNFLHGMHFASSFGNPVCLVRVASGCTDNIVVGNDLRQGVSSAPIIDGGTGTLLSWPAHGTYGDNFT